MAEQIGSKGAELDLLIKQGSTFEESCVLQNDDLSFVNLTGCTLRAQMRKNSTSAVAASFSFTITNAAAGAFTFGLTDTQTQALLADMQSEEAYASLYVWDMELLDSSNKVTPLAYGTVKVFREVTKV